jgi:ABC-type siderophore export system fused ATPase/permease subunit
LIVAITHDELFFGCCDRVIRLDAGKVVADTLVVSQGSVTN